MTNPEFTIFTSLSDGKLQPTIAYMGEYRDITPDMANYIVDLEKKIKELN